MSLRECESQKGSSFEKSQVVIDSEQEYQGPGPSIDKGEAEIDGKEFESEDPHTTVGADMPCWKVSDEKSRLNGGGVSRRYTSHSKLCKGSQSNQHTAIARKSRRNKNWLLATHDHCAPTQ